MPPAISSRRVVLFSFGVDVLDVVTNLVVAVLTGSAVVFAEMAQGLADAFGSALLVIGERRSRRPRSPRYPLGHAREAFFWGLLSAVAMLVIGAGLSARRGYEQLVTPQPLEHPGLAVAVLALAVVTNGYTVTLSARKLIAEAGSLRDAFRHTGRPLVKNAFLRDTVGTLSCTLGLVAMLLYVTADLVIFDAIGALVVALLMALSSIVLMIQARDLITGRSLPEPDLQRILEALRTIPEVEAVNRMAAVYSGSREVMVDLDLDLVEDLDTTGIECLLDTIESRVRKAVPEALRVRVDLSSPPGP
jgi:cation diffusion facilitator family transporter